jgi:hypothetical protein
MAFLPEEWHVLVSHQRLMFGRYESALASLLAEETGAATGSVEPFVASVALIAVLRAPFEASPSSVRPAQDIAATALDLLAGGLAAYAVAGHTGHTTASTSPRHPE